MPGLGGEELYRHIFDLYPATAAKVLFMTGDILNPETKLFFDSVPGRMLARPFEFSELERLVTAIIQPDI